MGTNFYALKHRIKKSEDLYNGLHIGKNSCGWVFHFQAYHKPNIVRVKQMKKVTFKCFIYDEYGEEYTYEDFWNIVEDSLVPDVDGRPNYVLVDPEYPHVISPFVEWEDEGFAFTLSDFC